jgi:outer membrane protein TolC
MKNNQSPFLILLFLILIQTAYSQQINLSDAISIAQEKNLKIQSSQSSKHASEKTLKASNSTYLPKVSLYAGYTHLGDELKLDMSQTQESFVDGLSRQQVATLDVVNQNINGVPLSETQKQNIYNASSTALNKLYPNFDPTLSYQDYFMASVLVNQPIFLGGKINSMNNVAESNYKIAEHTSNQTSDLINSETVTQYFTLLLLKEKIKTRKATYDGMLKHNSSTIKLIKAEIIPAFYEYGAKAAVSDAESMLQLAEHEYETSMNSFKTLLNVPLDTIIQPKDSLYFVDIIVDIDEAREKSLEHSYLLKINQEAKSIAQSNISMSKSGNLPNIFAVGEIQLYQKNLPAITPPWMLGLQLKWDIFNGGKNMNHVKAAKLYKDVADKENELITRKLETEVVNAYNRVQNTKLIYLNQIETKNLSQKNFHSIEKQYKHGLVRSNEVITANVLFQESRLKELETLYLYYLAVIELHTLKGDLNTFVQNYETAN